MEQWLNVSRNQYLTTFTHKHSNDPQILLTLITHYYLHTLSSLTPSILEFKKKKKNKQSTNFFLAHDIWIIYT